jgi:glycerol uptake facilitator-like aquaporin
VQIIGAMMAQLMLDLIFLISIKSTEDQNAVFAMHATTRPKSENSSVKLQYTIAFITEAFGTLILLLTLKKYRTLWSRFTGSDRKLRSVANLYHRDYGWVLS